MPKDTNPLIAPELRPIEKYWAIMKQALRKHPKEVKSEEDMKKKWISIQKYVGSNFVQDLMSSIKRKVRAFGYGIEIESNGHGKG